MSESTIPEFELNKKYYQDTEKANISLEKFKLMIWEIFEKEKEVHHFEIEDNVKEMLFKTDFTHNLIHLPFPRIKIDCSYLDEEKGFLLEEFYITETKDKILISYIHRKENDLGFGTLELNKFLKFDCKRGISEITTKEGGKISGKEELIKRWGEDRYNQHNQETLYSEDKMVKFLGNFINYINSKDIEIINYDRTIGNPNYVEKRLKRGKIPKPITHIIKITGKLKLYINNLKEETGSIDFTNKFWVRGHWRELRSIYYKNLQGKMIWIMPYIRGKGELIYKKYFVEKEEN